MTPTPPSTTSSSAGAHSPDSHYRVVRKRNRIPLSCAPCRHRKLKCNRAHPCENCVKRGDASQCTYAAPGARKKNQSSHGSSSSDEMQNRIDRLEGLVLSLMTNGAQSAGLPAANAALSGSASTGSADYPLDLDEDDTMIKGEADREGSSEVDGVTKSFGFMKVDATKTFYVSDGHWATILHDIAEVKNYFADHKQQYEDQEEKVNAFKDPTMYSGPGFLFGASDPPPRSEITSSLPSRSSADKLVARYFNSYDPAVHIIHGPTFQREYETHWKDPNETGFVWLGGLFAIMSLAMQSYLRSGDEPPEFKGRVRNLSDTYRKRTVECLTSADICKPVPGMIETLILHLQGEFSRNRDSDLGVWMVGGVIARLAMRMGYHRDPKPFPSIKPFQAEMRRRVWTFVRQLDLLFSFQMGLPNMIRAEDTDTALPGNLYDDEFWEGIPELPPSRPITEPTPVSYMITKSKFSFIFGKVVEQASSLGPTSYDKVIELNEDLERERALMPPHLKIRPIEQSVTDPANLIMQRFNLDLLYLKCQCVLHRKFLCYARTSPRYDPSSRACVDASMGLLEHQATLNRESRPHGRLRSLKWFISSLTTHDFLLAAMIVSLTLHHCHENDPLAQSVAGAHTWDAQQRAKMVQALETSRSIWSETKDESMEAYKASTVLGVLLEKIKTPRSNAGPKMQMYGSNARPEDDTAASCFERERPEHSAAMTLGMMSSGGMNNLQPSLYERNNMASSPSGNVQMTDSTGLTPGSYPMDATSMSMGQTGLPITSLFESSGDNIDMPTSLDWDAWDSYVQGTNFDPSNQIWPSSMELPGATPGIDAPIEQSQLQQQQQQYSQRQNPNQQQQMPMYPLNDSVFMGVNSPSNNSGL
ncbi:MAG: hypothetical protein M4579_003960 [Chaenotheca gracillima]|nr:MAG: hypothetical protein M4579_003960 [Chaenotheca gracillima]